MRLRFAQGIPYIIFPYIISLQLHCRVVCTHLVSHWLPTFTFG